MPRRDGRREQPHAERRRSQHLAYTCTIDKFWPKFQEGRVLQREVRVGENDVYGLVGRIV